jgi:hypothetical protein
MKQPTSHTRNTRIKTSKQHQFSEVPHADIRRSKFDRSHGLKTTFSAGDLVPVFFDEALPGDSFSLNMTAFARLATPINPTMDNAFMDTHFFSCPVRLIWDDWQEFMGETKTYTNPTSTTLPQQPDFDAAIPVIPTITSTAVTGEAELSLSDYLGIPTKVPDLVFSAMWHRAYTLIWNEWFRDENLQNFATLLTTSGADATPYALLKRGKRYDYFTSALPWPQKGADVLIPMGTSAPITGFGKDTDVYSLVDEAVRETDGTGTVTYASAQSVGGDTAAARKFFVEEDPNNAGYPNIRADLTNATAVTINQLRLAFATQKFLEKQARGGSRYIEVIKSHFNVTSPDSRLQRPEYIGGGSSPVNISPVAQTMSTDATSPQGNLAGIGTTVLNQHGFTKSFTEHCILIGLVSVRADLTYQQGLNRMYSRQTIYDYYWPTLSTIGEQAVLNKEIYAQGSVSPTEDAATWGYQERFAEYRYKPSSITGRFRSNATQTLDSWHYSEDFSVLPTLGQTFIQVPSLPIQRTLAVASEPQFIFDSLFSLNCTRPMPINSIPGGTHF